MTHTTHNAWLAAPGIVCALGQGMDEVGRRAIDGDGDGMVRQSGWLPGRDVLVGAAAGPLSDFADGMPAHHRSRNNQLMLTAFTQIEAATRQAIAAFGAARIGVVIGTSTSGVADAVPAFRHRAREGRWPADYDYRRQCLAAPAACLSELLGTSGPAYTISTACTSSARALLSAKRLLDAGLCDAVICGGVDTLCPLTLAGFAAIEALSPQRCNPCSARRDGINIGEAAVLFLMRRERPAGPAMVLLGGGASSDAWHMSAPDPTGAGAAAAMRAALADAGLAPADIDWVNLHGTGTPHNDAMESLAMQAVFGEGVACTSTKPMTGHALAAAGALEAALCLAVLQRGNARAQLPPHLWDGQADPRLPRLNLTGPGHALPGHGRHIVMSNSFAFGGSNASLIFGAPEPEA